PVSFILWEGKGVRRWPVPLFSDFGPEIRGDAQDPSELGHRVQRKRVLSAAGDGILAKLGRQGGPLVPEPLTLAIQVGRECHVGRPDGPETSDPLDAGADRQGEGGPARGQGGGRPGGGRRGGGGGVGVGAGGGRAGGGGRGGRGGRLGQPQPDGQGRGEVSGGLEAEEGPGVLVAGFVVFAPADAVDEQV